MIIIYCSLEVIGHLLDALYGNIGMVIILGQVDTIAIGLGQACLDGIEAY